MRKTLTIFGIWVVFISIALVNFANADTSRVAQVTGAEWGKGDWWKVKVEMFTPVFAIALSDGSKPEPPKSPVKKYIVLFEVIKVYENMADIKLSVVGEGKSYWKSKRCLLNIDTTAFQVVEYSYYEKVNKPTKYQNKGPFLITCLPRIFPLDLPLFPKISEPSLSKKLLREGKELKIQSLEEDDPKGEVIYTFDFEKNINNSENYGSFTVKIKADILDVVNGDKSLLIEQKWEEGKPWWTTYFRKEHGYPILRATLLEYRKMNEDKK